MVVFTLSEPEVSGPLQKLDLNDETTLPAVIKDGAVLLLKLKPETTLKNVPASYVDSNAAMVIFAAPPGDQQMFEQMSQRTPRPYRKMGNEPSCSGSCSRQT